MITMYDDINLNLIPKNAEAVAGYVNGRWPTYKEVVRRWPKAHHLSIAVSSNADADCLDVEPGDATNAVAPAWVRKQMSLGVARPVVYTSVSNAKALLAELGKAGIGRHQVRLWTAHYTGKEHLCGPKCGFGMNTTADATQWTDRALGRSLDQSLAVDTFFDRGATPAPPKPRPVPVPKPAPRPKISGHWLVTTSFYDGHTKTETTGALRLWSLKQGNLVKKGVRDVHAHWVETA